MIKTRITELFGIQHPIMLAGMTLISEPKLTAAVANAGGLGIFGAAYSTPDEVRQIIREIRKLTSKPFGVNQTLNTPTAKENMKVILEEKVPIINYALGRPWFIDEVHGYGGKVIGSVAMTKHAQRAEQLGVDVLSIAGNEAGAHGGDVTSMVLIPRVTGAVKLPVIAAGGFFDGRGLAAALSLGAEAVAMGTRFICTKECIVHDNFKQLIIKATEDDTLFSNVFDGMPGRVLKTEVTQALMKGGFPLTQAVKGAFDIKKALGLSFPQFVGASFKMMKAEDRRSLTEQARFASSNLRLRQAIFEGDTAQGLLYIGESVGGVKDIPTCKELIDRIIAQAEQTMKASAGKVH